MDDALAILTTNIPPPRPVEIDGFTLVRFQEKSVQQAIYLKLVAMTSGLRAALLLLRAGFVMEVGTICRGVDEAHEDALYLTTILNAGEANEKQQRYLKAFWAEEFSNFADTLNSHQVRDMVRRDRIRAHIAQFYGTASAVGSKASEIVSRMSSGFVHSNAMAVMECYTPGSFSTHGMGGTVRIEEYAEHLWNYTFRAQCAFIIATNEILPSAEPALHAALTRFEQETGRAT